MLRTADKSSRGGEDGTADDPRRSPARNKSSDSLRAGGGSEKKSSKKSHRGGDIHYDGRSIDVASSRSSDGLDSHTAGNNVLDSIPSEYLKRPQEAEPILYYLPKLVASHSNSNTKSGSGNKSSVTRFPNLRVLLAAAEDDIRLHRARQQAGMNRDKSLLQTYKIETDSEWLARQQRLNERELLLGKLDAERSVILKDLWQGATSGLTAKEATAIQLARWQRALELYVYHPPPRSAAIMGSSSRAAAVAAAAASANGGGVDRAGAMDQQAGVMAGIPQNLDFLELLEKLMETSAEVSS